MDTEGIFYILLFGGIGGLILRLGWHYRTGKNKKHYFHPDKKRAEFAAIAIPFSIPFLSLSLGLSMAMFFPKTGFLNELGSIVMTVGIFLGFALVFFPKSVIYPSWVNWIDQNHKDNLNILRKEVANIGLNQWAERVQTQEDLESWIIEVYHKYGISRSQNIQKMKIFPCKNFVVPIELRTDLWKIWNGLDFSFDDNKINSLYSFMYDTEEIFVDISILKNQDQYEIWSTSDHPVLGMSEEVVGKTQTLNDAFLLADKHLHDWEVIINGVG
ncbi:MAG: hypothetical protein GY805_19695 [Chloroflexi bacterium]|nr:hypothetical protein [Chloroflexota bacterium]